MAAIQEKDLVERFEIWYLNNTNYFPFGIATAAFEQMAKLVVNYYATRKPAVMPKQTDIARLDTELSNIAQDRISNAVWVNKDETKKI